jgi:hypothetical protein
MESKVIKQGFLKLKEKELTIANYLADADTFTYRYLNELPWGKHIKTANGTNHLMMFIEN